MKRKTVSRTLRLLRIQTLPKYFRCPSSGPLFLFYSQISEQSGTATRGCEPNRESQPARLCHILIRICRCHGTLDASGNCPARQAVHLDRCMSECGRTRNYRRSTEALSDLVPRSGKCASSAAKDRGP